MDYCLSSGKPLFEPILDFCKSIYIEQNEFENIVCKMGAILPQPQCAKCFPDDMQYFYTSLMKDAIQFNNYTME